MNIYVAIRCIAGAAALAGLEACRPASPDRPGDAAPRPRIVSLAPSLTEIVCLLGGENHLVGRTSACDYPPGPLDRVPVVGGFGKPSLERLVALNPDVVLDVDLEDESLGGRIEELGLRRERIPCRTLDDIPRAIRSVGDLLGQRDAAAEKAEALEHILAHSRAAASTRAGPRPRVLTLVWDDPPMTAGRSSFLSELIALAGGENLGDAVEQEFYRVSLEWIMLRDPEIVLCLFEIPAETVRERLATRPGWDRCSAVRAGRVYAGFDLNVMLRPGPRVLDSLDALKACIGGE